jgi:hypothetical protein
MIRLRDTIINGVEIDYSIAIRGAERGESVS